MSPAENAAIAALTTEVREYHADLQAFKEEVRPALVFYAQFLGVGRFAKWGVGIGAGLATIAASLRVIGLL
jgi:hypothetical protein